MAVCVSMGVELPKLRNYNLDSNVGRVFLILDASRNILDSTPKKLFSSYKLQPYS